MTRSNSKNHILRTQPGEIALLIMALLGLLAIVALISVSSYKKVEETSVASIAAYFFLTALCALAFGSLIGLLFSIPRPVNVISPTNTKTDRQGTAPYSPQEDRIRNFINNNNLVQVADWLTKIIIGITLVNLGKIPGLINQYASTVAGPIAATETWTKPVVLMTSIFFALLGLLIMYLWGQMYLLRIFDSATKVNLTVVGRMNSDLGEYSNNIAGIAITKKPGPFADDPWRGSFKPLSVDPAHKRELTATVTPSGVEGIFVVDLSVRTTDPANPLAGEVQFFLHFTFANDRPVVPVISGEAELRLYAYGAFTVGVLADGGATELSLDLSSLSTAPQEFREN